MSGTSAILEIHSDVLGKISLMEDNSGNLWIGSYGGLDKLDRANKQFVHYQHDPANPNSLSEGRVRSIFEDKSGTIWIGTDGGGLNKFNPSTEQFSHYKHESGNPNSLSHNYIFLYFFLIKTLFN